MSDRESRPLTWQDVAVTLIICTMIFAVIWLLTR